jgi:hypothetical protein
VCRNCGLVFLEDSGRDFARYHSEEYDCRLAQDGRFVENAKGHVYTTAGT